MPSRLEPQTLGAEGLEVMPCTKAAMNRRAFIMHSALTAAMAPMAFKAMARATSPHDYPIKALLPWDSSGHQFLLYSDSCSGVPGHPDEARHRKVNEMIQRISPDPQFIAFPGDTIQIGSDASQWEYWLNVEMKWLKDKKYPLYQSTSNHHSHNPQSDEVFRKYNPRIPQNGPEGQKGLAYYVRNGNLLYVSTHQPGRIGFAGTEFSDYRKDFRFDDTAWLEKVLEENQDAYYKFVVGHYPVFPINGYLQAPQWCFKPYERAPFWNTLVKHDVTAYLCSHIIAFDVKAMNGVLQITSAGAGTAYGPGTFMPGPQEYLHATQVAVDRQGLRYQVLDIEGKMRESLSWPFKANQSSTWLAAREIRTSKEQGEKILVMRLSELSLSPAPYQTAIGLLQSEQNDLRVGVDLKTEQLTVELYLKGLGRQYWTGPRISFANPLDVQLAFHPGMGPGGVLWRWTDNDPWSSMASTSASGLEAFEWSGPIRKQDENLQVHFALIEVPSIWS